MTGAEMRDFVLQRLGGHPVNLSIASVPLFKRSVASVTMDDFDYLLLNVPFNQVSYKPQAVKWEEGA